MSIPYTDFTWRKQTSKKWSDQIQEAEQDFSQRDKLMVKLKFHNRNIIQAAMMISVTWNMRCQEANVWALNHESSAYETMP